MEPSIEGVASHSIPFDDLCLEFPNLVNFVDFVGYGLCFDDELCSACKEIEEILKTDDIALPTTTIDNSSVFLNSFG